MGGILKYDQAKLRIFQEISDLNLKTGDRLPPEREFVDKFGLSLITVRRAMRELENEKIIRRTPRVGTFLVHPIRERPDAGTVLYLRIYKEEYGERLLPDGFRTELEAVFKEKNIRLVFYNAARPDLEFAKLIPQSMGVFVIGWLNTEWRSFLKSFDRPVVVMGSNPFPKDFHTVTYDFESAAAALFGELADRGFRKIGLLNGGRTYVIAQQIDRGFRAEAERRGLPIDGKAVVWVRQTHIWIDIPAYFKANPDLGAVIIESGALDTALAAMWQMNYSRKVTIALFIDNRDTLRPATVVRNSVIACFQSSITAHAAKLMMEELVGTGNETIRSDLLQAAVYNGTELIDPQKYTAARQYNLFKEMKK